LIANKTDYDLCVIGGGAAGLVVAAGGAAIGAKVILVEKNRLGGDCLYTGCVPSKALLHTAKVAQTVRDANHFGLNATLDKIQLADPMAYVQSVISSIEPHDSPERFRSLGVEVVLGQGRFSGSNLYYLNGRAIRARNYVIATGSRPLIPDIDGLGDTAYFTNENLFSVKENIEQLIVLGTGAIGIELAQAIRRLGSKVIIIGRGKNILGKEDNDLAKVVFEQLVDEGAEFRLGYSINNVKQRDGNIKLSLKDSSGKTEIVQGSHLLVATGRVPNIEDLDLDTANIKTRRSGIIVDNRMRTTNKKIFACGDVAGPYQFTHMAEHQAGVVLRNALFHLPAKTETRTIPWCTFTDPELARVGLSETEAIKNKVDHEVYRFSFSEIDRARTDSTTKGFIKVVTGRKGKILGAGIAGSQAGELIHEYALAIKKEMKLGELSSLIHIYPTLAQINRRVADSYLKSRLTPTAKRWIKRLFRLRGTD
jgi:pyruvate/2-oxoglutarate dehydrogenase complex dihydrolipoamide dehydrogenase (E3) component